MRTLVLAVAVGFVGCAKPQPVEVPAVVLASAAVEPPAVDVAPPPHAIEDDYRRPARMDWHRSSKDPILRDLARGHIKAGDEIEPLVRQNPHYRVLRFGDYVVMEYAPGYDGTLLVGKGGTVRLGSTSSCIYQDEFIQSLSPEEWNEYSEGYSAARQKRLDAWAAFPAAVGLPAAQSFWWRPPLPR